MLDGSNSRLTSLSLPCIRKRKREWSKYICRASMKIYFLCFWPLQIMQVSNSERPSLFENLSRRMKSLRVVMKKRIDDLAQVPIITQLYPQSTIITAKRYHQVDCEVRQNRTSSLTFYLLVVQS